MSKGHSQEGTKMASTGRVLKIVIKRKGNAARAGVSTVPGASVAGQAPVSATAYRRKLLEGYPGPSASAHAIVASLRAGWQDFPSSSQLPRWDECLVIPVYLTDVAPQLRKGHQRDGKRSREQLEPSSCSPTERPSKKKMVSCEEDTSQCKEQLQRTQDTMPESRPAAAAAAETQAEAGARKQEEFQTWALDTSENATATREACVAESVEQQAQHRPGSTTSDHATMTMFPSPSEQPEAQAAICQQEHLEQASARCAAQPEDLQPQNRSVACQTGRCVMLPPSCLDSAGRSSAAASMSSVAPSDLHPPRSARWPPDKVDDDFISTIMQKAKSAKYAADKQRGGMTAPWTVDALCKYVHSAIMFMEACEYILRATKDRTGRLMKLKASTVPGLYGSTAKLLSYTANAAETAIGTELGKDALRILSERLCAVCHLREAVHAQSRYTEASSKAHQLSLKFVQQSQHHADGTAHPSAEPEVTHGQPSPNDSMNSSQDVVMASSRAPHAASQQPVQPPHVESIQRLVEQAKHVTRFSDLIRRSTLGFQTFLERPDYRNSQDAKLVSMHVAVVSMDFGCVDGFRLLAHATKALANIAAMSVAAH